MEVLEGGKKLSSRKMHDLPQHPFWLQSCFFIQNRTRSHKRGSDGIFVSLGYRKKSVLALIVTSDYHQRTEIRETFLHWVLCFCGNSPNLIYFFFFQDMFDPHGWSEDSYYEALGNSRKSLFLS